MNPSGFVTERITRLMHGLDGFLERPRPGDVRRAPAHKDA